jgi:hypothetical protein
MRRGLITIGLLLTATLAGAQAPPAQTPGDKCLAELPQWQAHAQHLKSALDVAAPEAALWKARREAAVGEIERLQRTVSALQKKIADLEKASAPKP